MQKHYENQCKILGKLTQNIWKINANQCKTLGKQVQYIPPPPHKYQGESDQI